MCRGSSRASKPRESQAIMTRLSRSHSRSEINSSQRDAWPMLALLCRVRSTRRGFASRALAHHAATVRRRPRILPPATTAHSGAFPARRPLDMQSGVDARVLGRFRFRVASVWTSRDRIALQTADGVAVLDASTLALIAFFRACRRTASTCSTTTRLRSWTSISPESFAREIARMCDASAMTCRFSSGGNGDVYAEGRPLNIRSHDHTTLTTIDIGEGEVTATFGPHGRALAFASVGQRSLTLIELPSKARSDIALPVPARRLTWTEPSRILVEGHDGACVVALDPTPRVILPVAAPDHATAGARSIVPRVRSIRWANHADEHIGRVRRAGRRAKVNHLFALPDGSGLLVLDHDGVLHLVGVPAIPDAPDLAREPTADGATRVYRARHRSIGAMALTQKDDLPLVGESDGSLRLLDVRASAFLREFALPGRSTHAIRSEPGDTLLVVRDDAIYRVSIDGGTDLVVPGRHEAVARGPADRGYVVDREGIALLETAETPWRLSRRVALTRHQHFDVAVSSDGARVAVGAAGPAFLFDENLDLVARLDEHLDAVSRVAFAPDARTLATAGADGVIALWDARDGRLVGRLIGHAASVDDLSWNADGTLLASTSGLMNRADGLIVWDVARREAVLRAPIARRARCVVVTRDGRVLAGDDDGCLFEWPLPRVLPADSTPPLAARPARNVLGRCSGARAVWVSSKPFDPHQIGLPDWDCDWEEQGMPQNDPEFARRIRESAARCGVAEPRSVFILYHYAHDVPVGALATAPEVYYLGTSVE